MTLAKTNKKQLTVDRIYGEPNLSGLSIGTIGWSPDGTVMSYILESEEAEELWGFEIATQTRRMLFDFSRMTGTTVINPSQKRPKINNNPVNDWHSRRIRAADELAYQWLPDSKKLIVTVTGAAPCLLDLATNQLVPVSNVPGAIRDTKVAPNGRFISFVRGWDLFMIDMSTAREIPLTAGSSESLRSATPDTMGDLLSDSGHWWSPDSTQIAYLQTDERGVPVFWYSDLMSSRGQNVPERFPQPGDPIPVMGLKVASARGHVFIDTRAWAQWYLARVSWLPDSRHLALQMLNREQTELCLVLADSQTGATRTILKETDPAWINVSDDLRFFSDSRRFLWSSERDSWRHLYLYDINGTELLQLTTGPEACVAVNQLDEANNAVYYLVWPDPYTEGHLKRVSFSAEGGQYLAGETSQVTTLAGTHFAHLSPDCRYFADIHSTAVNPPKLDVYSTAGKLIANVETNPCEALADYGLKEFQFLSVPAAKLGIASDDMPLQAKLLEPAGLEAGRKYPVIVYIYGGPLPGGFGLARNAINYWRPVPELWLQMMAQRGYGIFSLDNRGSNAAPRGHNWETPIHRRLGHVELADQLEGVKFLKSLPWVDPDRIGIIGGSFGGFMTLNAMFRSNGQFKAGVAYAPVTNWREYDCVYTERYMDLPEQNPEGYNETAISNYAQNLEGQLDLIHGAADPNVHLQHSIQLIDQLIMESKRFGMSLYPQQQHMSFFGMGQSPARLWAHITRIFSNGLAAK